MPSIPANAKLLLHCDGTDGSTTFTDDSGTSKTVTANGNAQVDTAQKKFGTGSLLLDGTGDFLSVPDNADWNLGTGDFTIAAWIRFNATNNYATLCSQYESNTKQWRMLIGTTNSVIYVDNTTTTVGIVNSWTPSTNTWYHFAVTRSGNTWRMFVDGTQIGTDQTDSDTVPDFTGSFRIGTDFNGSSGSSNNFNGWIDEFILVKGTALYTANFTPPTVPFGTPDPTGRSYGYIII